MDKNLIKTLKTVTTGTLTTVMLKRGIRTTWMKGTLPYSATEKRVVGPAFTLRFVPAREDLATPAAWKSPTSTRGAIEAMPNGCIAIVDARGITDAGIFGDILCARMVKRGVAALITDGVMRDAEGVRKTKLPVWCAGTAAPPSVASLVFVGWQQPIGIGGCAVFPDDVIVADGDGAVVIPKDIAKSVAEEAVEQERLEGWIVGEVERGLPLPGLYPANDETMARYRADMSKKKKKKK
jgi:regulator of RNase E activity RraA